MKKIEKQKLAEAFNIHSMNVFAQISSASLSEILDFLGKVKNIDEIEENKDRFNQEISEMIQYMEYFKTQLHNMLDKFLSANKISMLEFCQFSLKELNKSQKHLYSNYKKAEL